MAENPYRVQESYSPGEALFSGPRDVRSGPGLMGGDIDSIARRHHYMGREEATLEARTRESQLRDQIADAWDEGYRAGHVEGAQLERMAQPMEERHSREWADLRARHEAERAELERELAEEERRRREMGDVPLPGPGS